MRVKTFILGFMTMLALCMGHQSPLLAATKAEKQERNLKRSFSSSDQKQHHKKKHHKKNKCCKKTRNIVKKIDQTTTEDLIVDQATLDLANQINQTTTEDLIVDQATLDLANQINQTTQADLAVDEEILGIVSSIKDCACKCQLILPKDFKDSKGNFTKTYVITEPGSYCLGADVDFAPVDDFTPAIQILSNNVNVDLGGFRLDQTTDVQGIGILIGQGKQFDDPNFVLKNISVTNGSITNFKGVGIQCYNPTFDANPSVGIPFESLAFTNLNILDCGASPSALTASGIELTSNAPFVTFSERSFITAFKEITIEKCRVNRCLGYKAILLENVENIVITDTQANDLTSINSSGNTSGGFIASYHIFARNLQMYNCQGNGTTNIDKNSINTEVGSQVVGVNAYLKDCQFNDTYGEADAFVHFNCSNSINFIAEDCQFNNSTHGPVGNGIAEGIFMADTGFQDTEANGMKFINCQFNGARNFSGNSIALSPFNQSSGAFGFYAYTLRNITFENCQACNIGSLKEPISSGFNIRQLSSNPIPFYGNVQNITFLNCTVSDVNSAALSSGFNFMGLPNNRIGQQSISTNLIFNNCIVERIYSPGSAIGIGDGVYTFSDVISKSNNLLIKDCRISDVRGLGSSTSAGINVTSVNRPVIQGNSISDCDRGILFTGSGLVNPNNIFQLATSPLNARANPPVFVNLKGNKTYSTGLASQGDGIAEGRIITGVGTTFAPIMTPGGVLTITTPAGSAGDYSATVPSGSFAPPPPDTGLAGNIVASIPLDATSVPANVSGKIALIQRGIISFAQKVANAQAGGAIGVIIFNNVPTDDLVTMTGITPASTIPAIFISGNSGNLILANISGTNTNGSMFAGSTGTIQFGSVSGTASQTLNIVTATTPVFTSDMIGDTISFPNSAYSAYIVDVLSLTTLQVDTFLPAALAAQPFTVNLGITPTGRFNSSTEILVPRSNYIAPAQPFTLTYGYPGGLHTFQNLTRGNSITIPATLATVDGTKDTILSPTSMNTLGWKVGDQILYTASSPSDTIPDLVSGNTYFLINYTPGFTDRGVVENNTVDNCTIGGYIETRPGALITTIAAASDLAPLPAPGGIINVASTAGNSGFPVAGTLLVQTSAGLQTVTYTGITATSFTGCAGGTGVMSTGGLVTVPGELGVGTTTAWINNVAVDNGSPCTDTTNYSITWLPGPNPVDGGFVGGPFPAGSKYDNLSLKP